MLSQPTQTIRKSSTKERRKNNLQNIAPQNIYTVPVKYFEGLAAQVLNRIKAMKAVTDVKEWDYLSHS